MKNKIAFLTAERLAQLLPYDQKVAALLSGEGLEVHPVIWDQRPLADVLAELAQMDVLIVRTIWGYHEDVMRFSQLIEEIQQLDLLTWNPPEVLVQNLNKKYLGELSENGISIVPTRYLSHEEELDSIYEERVWRDVVIKPTISAGAKHTWRSNPDHLKEDKEKLAPLIERTDFMVQPYLKEVGIGGEFSYIFFSNGYRYAVKKLPKEGDYRVQVQFGGKYSLHEADGDEWRQISDIRDRLNLPFLYMRIDGIWIGTEFQVMEIEMIEPDLYLDLHPEGVSAFAKAILEKI